MSDPFFTKELKVFLNGKELSQVSSMCLLTDNGKVVADVEKCYIPDEDSLDDWVVTLEPHSIATASNVFEVVATNWKNKEINLSNLS